MMIRCLTICLCAIGLASAQSAPSTTTATPGNGGVARGRGPGFGPGRGPGRGLDLYGRNSEARITKQLGLDATQQNTLHTALQSAQVQRKGLNEKAASLQKELSTAVKAGNEGAIESISRDLSALQEQETTIHAKTLSTLYNSLSSAQKTTIEPMINRELGVPGPHFGGRGPGGRGPRPGNGTPAPAQQ